MSSELVVGLEVETSGDPPTNIPHLQIQYCTSGAVGGCGELHWAVGDWGLVDHSLDMAQWEDGKKAV